MNLVRSAFQMIRKLRAEGFRPEGSCRECSNCAEDEVVCGAGAEEQAGCAKVNVVIPLELELRILDADWEEIE